LLPSLWVLLVTTPIRPEFDRPTFSLLPYLRLMRLPNVFTAFSNITMGFLFTHTVDGLPNDWPVLVLLLLSSGCLYLAGMVLNDLFDVEIDRQERPFRPLPSGQVSLPFAQQLGVGLLLLGVLCGVMAGFVPVNPQAPRPLSGIIVVALASVILLYNGGLKKNWLGPLAMGGCRFLNVLLGMSVPAIPPLHAVHFGFAPEHWLVAGGVGVYVLGITCFARGEAGVSKQGPLLLGLIGMLGGVAMLACLPWFYPVQATLVRAQPQLGALLFALLGFSIVRRAMIALTDPQPAHVQATVKHALLSIIIFDAAVTVLVAGPSAGLIVAALVVPAIFLGRWVYST
jgi:4-hydroxybenzoate polyprenyltransferase